MMLVAGFILFVLFSPTPAGAQTRDIIFPVLGPVRYSDDFGDPRSGGRTHEGTDIFGEKGRPLVAAVDGRVRWVVFPEPTWGWGLELEDEDGWRYRYLHLNNDTPGTDDGQGGGRGAYAPGMISGAPVKKGQLVGFMGDSGNAEGTTPHVHFEIRRPDGAPINPIDSLLTAYHVPFAVPRDPLPEEFFAYGAFSGGASVAVGDVDPAFVGEEIITGAGPGGGPHVRVFKNYNFRVAGQFFAYALDFRGGIDVAVADTNGDGSAEIITAPLAGRSPLVRIFSESGKVRHQFYAYDRTATDGVHVAAADLDGDGKAEIITAPLSGARPLVRVFSRKGELRREFLAYSSSFRGGIDVAAHAATDESAARIITAAGPGGGPHVRVFGPAGKLYGQFFPYDEGFRGGVRVSVAEQYSRVDGPEIFVVPASSGGPDFRVYSLRGKYLDRRRGFEPWWKGGYDIAAGTAAAYASSGPDGRPVSVWELD